MHTPHLTDQPVGRKATKAAPWLHATLWTVSLAAIWALLHRYQGFARDGELYAMQAMSRLNPDLKHDLYLQFASQDRFTLFSPVYALAIRALGLINAATLLFCLCAAWFTVCVKSLSAKLLGSRQTWIATAAVLIIPGSYGPFSIFSYTEDYLTARSLAEALVASALAAYFAGWRIGALLTLLAAMFIHPIMALPGLLLLLCLMMGLRRSLRLAVIGTIGLAMAATAVRLSPALAAHITLIDGAWYEMVLERSQFLFIQHWDRGGYEITANPIICLMLTAVVVEDERIRKLCGAAILIGISGLAINAIPSLISPIAILLQGQSWRWMWVTTLLSVMLIPSTMLRMAKEPRGGLFCASMLLLSWTFTDVDGLACSLAALAVWSIRHRLTVTASKILNYGVAVGALVIVVATVANVVNLLRISNQDSIRDDAWTSHVRNVAALGLPMVALVWAVWTWTARARSRASGALALGFAMLTGIAFFPGALRLSSASGTTLEISEFADWRQLIPSTSNVMLIPPVKSAAFVWFTLQRPSYLTVDQSSGVVFSSATSAEVKRRSEVLRPVADPDWRIYASIEHTQPSSSERPKPLTRQTLQAICGDPALGFVISQGELETGVVSHKRAGIWNGWKLYDCRYVREQIDN